MKHIDIFELSRLRRSVEGDLTLNELPELATLLEGEEASAAVKFFAQGTAGRDGLPGADLTIEAHLVTQCVRCGQAVTINIEKTLPFLFTQTEAQANAMDPEEDGEFEVVVGSTKFDLAAWVEEELILSLPAFPQHEDCEPDASQLSTKESEEDSPKAPNPFAVLSALKKH